MLITELDTLLHKSRQLWRGMLARMSWLPHNENNDAEEASTTRDDIATDENVNYRIENVN